jgi:hypothetical protein
MGLDMYLTGKKFIMYPTRQERALTRHNFPLGINASGVYMAETIFGRTITLSTGRVIPVRWIGEQHVREDLGFVPSFADWVRNIRPEPWMGRAIKLHQDDLKGGVS